MQQENFSEAFHRIATAARRMVETHNHPTRWLLDFLGRDLHALREGEWLDLQTDLKAFALFGPDLREREYRGLPVWRILEPLKLKSVQGLQKILRGGLKALLETGEWKPPPVAAPLSLRRIVEEKSARTRIIRYYATTLLDRVLLTGIDLIVSEGDRIGACEECGRLFLRVKRQAYCSRRCSQRTRDRRFRTTHTKEQLRKKRHQVYERRVRRLKGLPETTEIGRRTSG